MSRGHLALLPCDSGRPLCDRIVHQLKDIYRHENIQDVLRPIKSKEVTFANGEIKTELLESIRGLDLYIIQAFDDPLSPRTVNDNFISLVTAISAAKFADAENITIIVPQFPYSRQERRKTREAITAKLVTQFMEIAGADRVVTIDIHSEAVAGFFSKKFENLHAGKIIVDYIEKNTCLNDFTVVSPDVGSARRARYFAAKFQTDLAIIDKERNYSSVGRINDMTLVGDVDGKDVFMGDDMIATGGTLLKAAKLLKDKGAKDIYIGCTHPFFNGDAIEKFDAFYQDDMIAKVIATDSVFRGETFCREHPWYEEVSISQLFAQVIFNINQTRSISALLD